MRRAYGCDLVALAAAYPDDRAVSAAATRVGAALDARRALRGGVGE